MFNVLGSVTSVPARSQSHSGLPDIAHIVHRMVVCLVRPAVSSDQRLSYYGFQRCAKLRPGEVVYHMLSRLASHLSSHILVLHLHGFPLTAAGKGQQISVQCIWQPRVCMAMQHGATQACGVAKTTEGASSGEQSAAPAAAALPLQSWRAWARTGSRCGRAPRSPAARRCCTRSPAAPPPSPVWVDPGTAGSNHWQGWQAHRANCHLSTRVADHSCKVLST